MLTRGHRMAATARPPDPCDRSPRAHRPCQMRRVGRAAGSGGLVRARHESNEAVAPPMCGTSRLLLPRLCHLCYNDIHESTRHSYICAPATLRCQGQGHLLYECCVNIAFLFIFKNPGSAYLGKPFWACNGWREPSQLRRQIRVMHHTGLGSFFMLARIVLATPDLADQ